MTPDQSLEPIAHQEVQGSNPESEPNLETTESYQLNQLQEDNSQLPAENEFQNIPEQQDAYQASAGLPSQDNQFHTGQLDNQFHTGQLDNQFQEPYQDPATQQQDPSGSQQEPYQQPPQEPYQDPYQQPQQEPYQDPYQQPQQEPYHEPEIKDPYVDPGLMTENEYGNQYGFQEPEEDPGLLLHYLEYAKLFVSFHKFK